MQYLSIILSLAVAGSAIDIRLHEGAGCTGNRLVCNNINPNVCCYVDNGGYTSIGFFAIPRDWNIDATGYGGFQCSNYISSDGGPGHETICFQSFNGRGIYTSGRYVFPGKKRDVGEQECQKPDTLVLEDGQEYDITSMESSVLDEFLALTANVTNAAGVPEAFKKFEKNN